MSSYNLLYEKWIPVVVGKGAETKLVSIRDVFENASDYLALACDTKAQEFSVLRILLAINHTVFSRFDFEGEVYEYLQVDENYVQLENAVEEEAYLYEDDLENTWLDIWESKKFPQIIFDYLEKWEERFYLFDDKYPFMQVTEKDVRPDLLGNHNPTKISGKNINRLISESGNKISLFSPKNDFGSNKEILKEDEIARWFLTFQGYSGLSDKRAYGTEKYKSSKGWLFDLGGIYLEGTNLFETLMLNTVLYSEENYFLNIQKPAWEYSSEELLKKYLKKNNPLSIAELYTTWSRAIYISPNTNPDEPFSMYIVKLPDIDHGDKFLEPMTIWKLNKNGDYKDKITPKKHPANQAMWRSFGLITVEDHKAEAVRVPGVIAWYKKMSQLIDLPKIKINAISMKDDGNATSWVPVDEIYDYLFVDEVVIKDDEKEGWTPRVNATVEETKFAISVVYKKFLNDIREIRNIESYGFSNRKIEELYYLVDQPFREWISSIEKDDDKDLKILEWRKTLKKIIIREADRIVAEGTNRDFRGIEKNDKTMNIATAYSYFKHFLNKNLIVKEEYND
ncbi:MAG: type I-E CRISPR-associated protein Cse1/CasA [Bacillota bacterium]|nr:type I-E CRISPR-associated protein Cse1/CasA [Bacillota bacterium]